MQKEYSICFEYSFALHPLRTRETHRSYRGKAPEGLGINYVPTSI